MPARIVLVADAFDAAHDGSSLSAAPAARKPR